ncbi:MAG: penicillin-binding protein 1A [Methylobacillus sp.]|jgi:penicillin-binding protein 1A|nr:penicillin-binding protein 1A [Methylobacillus sp.]
MFPKKWWQLLALSVLVLGIAGTALVALAGVLVYSELPSLEALTDYRPKLPLRIYSEEGQLIGEFGEERRAFVQIEEVPPQLKQAILAAEDSRFYQHGGIDTIGVLRAILANITSGGKREGASTITMQVARTFFLSNERTYKRKFSEALLAIKIEHNLTKDQILELYINQIYLGQRAYGFAAAAQVYYGKSLDKLTTAECAMLAGLPKGPSSFNPVVNPVRAKQRQQYILGRMHEFKFIDDAQYKTAMDEPLKLRQSRQAFDLSAEYVAELVREMMYQRYQDDIYRSGLKVYTTIRKDAQEAANDAVLQGILDYEQRHAYRSPEGQLSLENTNGETLEAYLNDKLDDIEEFHSLIPAVVLEANPKLVKVYRKGGEIVEISGKDLQFVQKAMSEKTPEKQRLQVGSIIRVRQVKDKWKIAQLPQIEAALIAADPNTGAVHALVGGFDFNRNKFNHVTQAWRQPGSSFKPFIYSASLEKGFTPASVIEDEPIELTAEETGGKAWSPHNFDGKYDGPMRMRVALTKSKNMVSIRILQDIGVDYARDYITRFGFSAKDHPPYLAMALGSGSVTAWQMANAYSVFANGGYKVQPYIITRITDADGKLIEEVKPVVAGADAPRVLDPRNVFIMTSMLKDVTRVGTAGRARALGRNDIAGKTGTTNNHVDGWFAGFNPKQVAVAWMGYDQPKSLGGQETGGSVALPIWMAYMGKVLKGTPDASLRIPKGVVSIKIDPVTGAQAGADKEDSISEYFYQEFPPPTEEELAAAAEEAGLSSPDGTGNLGNPTETPANHSGTTEPQKPPAKPGDSNSGNFWEQIQRRF